MILTVCKMNNSSDMTSIGCKGSRLTISKGMPDGEEGSAGAARGCELRLAVSGLPGAAALGGGGSCMASPAGLAGAALAACALAGCGCAGTGAAACASGAGLGGGWACLGSAEPAGCRSCRAAGCSIAQDGALHTTG